MFAGSHYRGSGSAEDSSIDFNVEGLEVFDPSSERPSSGQTILGLLPASCYEFLRYKYSLKPLDSVR